MVQVIHELDVVEAIVVRAHARRARHLQRRRARRGAAVDHPARARASRPLPIPHPLAKPVLTALWRGKLTSFPVPELDHIRYVCMVDGTAREGHARLPAASHAQGDHPRGQ